MTKTAHIGRKIARLRELKEIKQETMAEALGISQQAVSKIEQSETIEDVTLGRIAKVLGFSPEVIQNYNEEAVINNIQNNYEGSNSHASDFGPGGRGPYHNCTFNPLDKLIEAHAKIEQLNEALLKEKDEKIALLQKMLDGR
ncbi:helix-turn-helix domain-containing protein [Chryseolinea lacunae]|uniref:Helix-turn-helix transcriptional regulator n=1 Tax=Chryseolinea lacunae TaxID=2801331 RepID=A0ABS1L1S3_9BACT|nr:helix-turn-helix transcriptional regulator [Chryseolinea lacunae]MBL0745487.1 helix-turn-helix transcriptional regulator [Chryseolinea lacunae]